jgi:hypothetical protein
MISGRHLSGSMRSVSPSRSLPALAARILGTDRRGLDPGAVITGAGLSLVVDDADIPTAVRDVTG